MYRLVTMVCISLRDMWVINLYKVLKIKMTQKVFPSFTSSFLKPGFMVTSINRKLNVFVYKITL